MCYDTSMKTTLITGASSGIGFELAKVCASRGEDLILVSRTGEKPLDDIFQKVKVTVIQMDLSEPGAAKKLYDQIAKKGVVVDTLINNAGFGDFNLFVDADAKKLSSMMQLNMVALTELTHLYSKDMVARKSGAIMNVASIASFFPGPYMAVYYATKHYVLALSEALAEELKDTGITVTALCPGPTASKFQDSAAMNNSKLVNGKKLPTAAEVASYGYAAMRAGKRVAVHGVGNKINAFSVRFLPRVAAAKIIRKLSAPK
jgi:uncharacterized protein